MRTSNRILAVTAAALLLGVSFTSAQALDLSLGGISASIGSSGSGSTTATVGVGGTSTSATIGGSNLLYSSTSIDDTDLNLGIGTNDGPLLTASSSDRTTDANINLGLGSLLGGVDLLPGGGGGGGGLTPIQLASAFGSLGAAEQQLLRNRCRAVLTNPAAFDPGLRELCRIIARMQVGLN